MLLLNFYKFIPEKVVLCFKKINLWLNAALVLSQVFFYFSLLTGLSVALDRKCCGLEINVLILIVEKGWKAGTLYLMNKMFISLLSINEMHGEMISWGEMVAT